MKKRLCLLGINIVKDDASKDLSEVETRVNVLAREKGLSERIEWGAEDPVFSKNTVTENPFGPDYVKTKESYPVFYYTGESWMEIRKLLEHFLDENPSLKSVNRLFFS